MQKILVQNEKPRPQQFRTTLATSSGSPLALPSHSTCLFCENPRHRLVDCFKFQSISVSERYKFAAERKICHNCLLVGHLATGCLERSRCKQEDCRRKHDTLLHPSNHNSADINLVLSTENEPVDVALDDEVEGPVALETSDEESHLDFHCNFTTSKRRTCLHVVPVRVKANGKEMLTHALLDTGSDVSLCSKKLIRNLGIKGKSVRYNLNTVSSSKTVTDGIEVSLCVSSFQNDQTIHLPKVWGVPRIPVDKLSKPTSKDLEEWDHLKGIDFPEIDYDDVDLLIGGDTPEAFWTLEQRVGKRKEPFAVKTLLGWTLMGPLSKEGSDVGMVNFITQDQQLNDQLQAFWKTDFNDIGIFEKAEMSLDDKAAMSIVESSTLKIDDHYQVGLPWRKDKKQLCGNVSMAKTRLGALKRRLLKYPELLSKYKEGIQRYIDSGYARVLSGDELNQQSSSLWYLPHHPVFNAEKPNKTRIVFDCAATFGGKSLNNFLLSGPDVTSSLLGVLLRFRKNRFALVGDIEGMFHQIKMPPTDAQKLCFLWWPDGDMSRSPVTCQMLVHVFGATSSPFCANFCLRKTATDNADLFEKDVVNSVLRSFYVDDCLTSVDTVDEGILMRRQLTNLLSMGGFRITKWKTNCKEIIKSIPTEDLAPSVDSMNLELSNLPIERALGIVWDTQKHIISFKWNARSHPTTKRGILSTISSVYDPLGIISPFILQGKRILQELMRNGVEWDEPVTDYYQRQWNSWMSKLPQLSLVNIGRCLKPDYFGKVVDTQLHHFSDASSIGYGCASYIRLEDANGNICCNFLLGKSRLAPVKTVSIPRLELTAATLSVKINGLLTQELDMPISSVYFWSDSKTVLKYINNRNKRFHTFVANRISIIHNGSDVKSWRYIRFAENPADKATRGMEPKDFSPLSLWLAGPQFLTKPMKFWPHDRPYGEVSNDDPEVKKEVNVHVIDSSDSISNLFSRYSTWKSLKRAVAWLLRYKKYIAAHCDPEKIVTTALSAEDISAAESSILTFVQRRDLYSITDGGKIHKRLPKTFQKLRPFIGGGLLRVGGRLSQAPFHYDIRHPIIVPKGHISNLIISDVHRRNGHVGVAHTWSLVRKVYWIIAGGSEVKRVIENCIICKKRNARPCQQIMADLPTCRVTAEVPPFHSLGVDYFGPLIVKQGRSTPKRYGCLFTCMASRAIHLEVAVDLSVTSFINAFRRFTSRRGTPSVVYSDNGTNFVGAVREIRDLVEQLKQRKVQDYMATHNIRWRFNSPRAPHMGGVWERMVGSVKTVLKSLLQNHLVNDDALHTLLLEVEHIVNSRPLIPISMDPAGEEPLTPNHLLMVPTTTNCFDESIFQKADNYANRRWKQVQFLAKKFWDRWSAEYLPLLQARSKWTKPHANLKIGDLVIVMDDALPRGKWPMAKVLQVYPGRDGNIRQVKIKTKDGTYERPVAKLCRINVDPQAQNA